MKYLTIFRAATMLLILGGCSSGDDDAGSLVDDFIPVISNAWQDIHSKNQYVLNADSSGVPQGTFTGFIENPDSADNPLLNGNFVHEKIQFTFTSGYPKGITYRGVIDTANPKVMRLANTSDPLHDSLQLERP